jgi:hypothetical protein
MALQSLASDPSCLVARVVVYNHELRVGQSAIGRFDSRSYRDFLVVGRQDDGDRCHVSVLVGNYGCKVFTSIGSVRNINYSG